MLVGREQVDAICEFRAVVPRGGGVENAFDPVTGGDIDRFRVDGLGDLVAEKQDIRGLDLVLKGRRVALVELRALIDRDVIAAALVGHDGGKGRGALFFDQRVPDTFPVEESGDLCAVLTADGREERYFRAAARRGHGLIEPLAAELKVDRPRFHGLPADVEPLDGQKHRVSHDPDHGDLAHRCFTLPKNRFSRVILCSLPPSTFPLI